MRIRTLLALSLTAGGAAACSGGEEACDPEAPGTICTIAGNGASANERGSAGDGGLAYDARFDQVMDMAIAPNGELWILDYNTYLVRAIGPDGIIRSVVGDGSGLVGDGPPPGELVPADSVSFNHMSDMAFHDGYLYLAGFHNSRVLRVELDTMLAENVAGDGNRLYYYGDEGPALQAALDLPSGIAFDPDGNLTIVDQANQVIRQVDQDGVIRRIAGRCVVDYDVPCAPGQQPVACPGSNKTTCGGLEECEKECAPGFGGDGGHCMEMRMAQEPGQDALPTGRAAYDPQGRLVFADHGNHRLRRIDTDGIIQTIAGTGEPGYSGDGGPAVQARLNGPVDLEVADDGTIYFADTMNNCVRKIDTAGIISTVAGQCGQGPLERGFAGDGGDPLQATLNLPIGIEVDGDRLYIADLLNHRVRVVNF